MAGDKAKIAAQAGGGWQDRAKSVMARPALGGRLIVGEAVGMVLVLAAFWALGWTSLVRKSVTYDEAQHVPVGLLALREGDFRIEPFSSPLPRAAVALPHWRSGARLPLELGWITEDVVRFGREFMDANADEYHRLFYRPRAMAMLMGSVLIVLAWRWARGLYGPGAGTAAAALCGLDPNIMAHSRLAAVDIPTALFFFATALAAWRWVERMTWARAAATGVLLGAALLSKITCMMLLPLLPALAAGSLARGPRPARWRPAALQMLAIYIIAWAIVCSFYGWKGFGTRVGDYSFQSGLLRTAAGFVPQGLPAPLPAAVAEGLDFVFVTNEDPSFDYLLGGISDADWPHYYIVAILAKTPVSTLLLWGFGLGSLVLVRGGRAPGEWWPAVLGAGFFAFVSLTSQMLIGIRYVLPALPFFYVLASRVWGPAFAGRARLRQAAWVLAGLSVVSNLLIYPHYLSYFNLASGGPARGHRLLADSNIDWGQDLIGLKDYLDREGIDRICLAYFGSAEPHYYGINYRFPLHPDQCEVLAVSVHFAVGMALPVTAHGRWIEFPYYRFAYLKDRTPDAKIGYSIWVFRQAHRDKPD